MQFDTNVQELVNVNATAIPLAGTASSAATHSADADTGAALQDEEGAEAAWEAWVLP
jgi:hypothetical protein